MHRAVFEHQGVEEVHLVERPLVLEPSLVILHVYPVVVSESFAHFALIGVITCSNLILTEQCDFCLCETGVGSQLLDVPVSESIDVNPLVSTEQVVDCLIMDTLRELALDAYDHLKMVELGVGVVEGRIGLHDVIMTALQDIA